MEILRSIIILRCSIRVHPESRMIIKIINEFWLIFVILWRSVTTGFVMMPPSVSSIDQFVHSSFWVSCYDTGSLLSDILWILYHYIITALFNRARFGLPLLINKIPKKKKLKPRIMSLKIIEAFQQRNITNILFLFLISLPATRVFNDIKDDIIS